MTERDQLERVEVSVRGRVQGVGYRYYVLGLAAELGLPGWVANEPDGTVRCVAEGLRPPLERFAEAVAGGPPGARVTEVRVSWSAAEGSFSRFEVRSGWHRGD